jgi:aspartokinase
MNNMFPDDEPTPYDMLIENHNNVKTLEKAIAALTNIIYNHQETLQNILLQNQQLAKHNKELTDYVLSIGKRSKISDKD